MKKSIRVSLGLGLLAIALTGCFHKSQIKQTAVPKPEPEKVAENVPPQEPAEKSTASWQDYKALPELENVHFDFDKANLRPEDRKILQKDYKVLADHKDWLVKIEGHCDIRGTIEYNFALGQRRAKIVADYYHALGLDEKRISTISYGKEKPLCTELNEACWSKNRRAMTTVRPMLTQVSSIKNIGR